MTGKAHLQPIYLLDPWFISVSLCPFMDLSLVSQVFVCLWKGCKVYNTPSTSQSWLQRHMLTHSGDKPFKVKTTTYIHSTVRM